MNQRKIIIIVVAVLILVIGKFGMEFMAKPKEKIKPVAKEKVVTVFTEDVNLRDITIEVSTTGSLQAKDRMELYSEVQGLMLPDNGRFKAGNHFSKGQTLVSLRADDAKANVVSQRSNFVRSISSVMADMRLDYPNSFETWNTYLQNVNVNESLPSLPDVPDPKLKNYLTGRSIYSTYYSVRNAEISLSRFHISAPFSGVLVSANANPGTVVRPGQLLGVFVKPGKYELQASTNAQTVSRLKKGQKVSVYRDGVTGDGFVGKVIRVNASINPQTQMSDFFVEINSDELKEGQFMRVEVQAEVISEAYELNRSALKDSRFVFVVENDLLRKKEVSIIHTTDNTAVIRGLENSEVVLNKIPPAAFDGMKVNIYKEKSEE